MRVRLSSRRRRHNTSVWGGVHNRHLVRSIRSHRPSPRGVSGRSVALRLSAHGSVAVGGGAQPSIRARWGQRPVPGTPYPSCASRASSRGAVPSQDARPRNRLRASPVVPRTHPVQRHPCWPWFSNGSPVGSVASGPPGGRFGRVGRAGVRGQTTAAALIRAPAGKSPPIAYRHNAMSSRRASATIPIRRTRAVPPPYVRRYHRLSALPGW